MRYMQRALQYKACLKCRLNHPQAHLGRRFYQARRYEMFTTLRSIFCLLFVAKRTRKKQLETQKMTDMDLIRYRNALHCMRSEILNQEISWLIDQGKVEDAMHLVRQSREGFPLSRKTPLKIVDSPAHKS